MQNGTPEKSQRSADNIPEGSSVSTPSKVFGTGFSRPTFGSIAKEGKPNDSWLESSQKSPTLSSKKPSAESAITASSLAKEPEVESAKDNSAAIPRSSSKEEPAESTDPEKTAFGGTTITSQPLFGSSTISKTTTGSPGSSSQPNAVQTIGSTPVASQASDARLLEEKPQVTGEEGERNLFQLRCRLYVFEDGEWKGREKGTLRLNEKDGFESARMVMRAEQTLKLCLNSPLAPGMRFQAQSLKSITGWVFWFDGERKNVAFRFTTPENATDVLTKLSDTIKKLPQTSGSSLPNGPDTSNPNKARESDVVTGDKLEEASSNGTQGTAETEHTMKDKETLLKRKRAETEPDQKGIVSSVEVETNTVIDGNGTNEESPLDDGELSPNADKKRRTESVAALV